MVFVNRRCTDKDEHGNECGAEVAVAIDEKHVIDSVKTWKCPRCLGENTLYVAIAR
jgi:hypothetical protein